MASIFPVIGYFYEFYVLIFTATLRMCYEVQIKPKLVEKERLADLNANKILIQTASKKECYVAMVGMNQGCYVMHLWSTNDGDKTQQNNKLLCLYISFIFCFCID